MASDVPDDLRVLLDMARDYLRTREGVRHGVAAIGRALTALAAWSEPGAEASPPPPVHPEPTHAKPPEPEVAAVTTPVVPVAKPVSEPPRVPIALLPPLTFAPPPPVAPYPVSDSDVCPEPLGTIAARCRLKADACRFTARRAGGADDRDAYQALIAQARTIPDCYLWVLEEALLSEPAPVWDELAGAFTAAADAAEMLRVWWELPEAARDRAASDVLHLAAEAQGVLFSAVARVRRGKPDPDQIQLFVTLREEAARIRVFVTKFLKREDHAPPSGGPDVSRRMKERFAPLQRIADAGKNRHKVLANLRYKAGRLRADPVANADEWPRVAELLDELVTGGLAPSNSDVREYLLPVFDMVPEELDLPPGAVRVFREIDRYLASRPAPEVPPASGPLSAEVTEARHLLAGRRVVLIGGQVRPAQRDSLIEALGLADLDWISTEDHESVSIFEAPIARPEVAVVLLAIRWSNHSYGDVQEFCDRFGKLLVRLPGGYHPNQVAHQILKQVAQRLRSAG